jgi:transposase InsO family protein
MPPDVRTLIRTMSEANPLWGAPRLHGELLRLGIDICQATVAKYMVRRRQPPSQTWRTLLTNHMEQLMAADFFVVPTATCRFLFVLVIVAHDRRRVAHVAVTGHPTAMWTAQQLREAFPWDEVPRYLLRDRDHAFDELGATAHAMGIHEVLTAPRSPWQNAFCERLIGTARRECLDHVIPLHERHLRKILAEWVSHYNRGRPHTSLGPGIPEPSLPAVPRSADHQLPHGHRIAARPILSGLHHEYRLEPVAA